MLINVYHVTYAKRADLFFHIIAGKIVVKLGGRSKFTNRFQPVGKFSQLVGKILPNSTKHWGDGGNPFPIPGSEVLLSLVLRCVPHLQVRCYYVHFYPAHISRVGAVNDVCLIKYRVQQRAKLLRVTLYLPLTSVKGKLRVSQNSHDLSQV